MLRRRAMPRRPRYSDRRRLKESESRPCRYWASRTAASRPGPEPHAAMSTMVRRSVVTGIPFLTVTSSRPKSLAMTAHSLRRSGRPGRRDFDGSRSLVARYPPESRRRSMAHGRSETTDEHGRHPPPLSGHLPATHRVHTGMESVQQPVPDAAGDRLPSKLQLEELVAGHHAVLPPRQSSNHRVGPLSLRLYLLGTCKRRLGGHWTMVPAAASRVARGLWRLECAPGPGGPWR